MGSILSLLSGLANSLAGWIGIRSKELDLRNAPDVRQAAVNQDEANATAKTNQAISKKDAGEIQRELAE